jgi:competence protein ComGC
MQLNKKLKWFTLVEMLIVIVIIWVLAAALIPRLTSVRWRANDVARRADMQQVATAIVSYSMDKWEYPSISTWGWLQTTGWVNIKALSGLLRPYINSLPEDPSGTKYQNDFKEYGTGAWFGLNSWNYVYMTLRRWWGSDNWFAIISIAESEWWANRIYGGVGTTLLTWSSSVQWWRRIQNTDEANDLVPCRTMTKVTSGATARAYMQMGWDCYYNEDVQLRYVIIR